MGKPYSMDLRERVVGAVERQGPVAPAGGGAFWCQLQRGDRLGEALPHRRWKTMTFLAALRHDRVDAPWLLDGPINGERSASMSRGCSFQP